MAIQSEAKRLVSTERVVYEAERVREVLIVLPNIGQAHFKTTCLVPLNAVVVEEPMEQVVGLSQISETTNTYRE